MPLASTFRLSTKIGKESYVEPVIEGQGYRFTVKVPGSGTLGSAGVPPAQGTSISKDGAENLGVPPAQGDGAYKSGAGTPDPSPAQGTKLGRGPNFRCLMSGTPIAGDYIKAEGQAGRMGARLMAIVAEGDYGRVYLAPTSEHEERAREANPKWRPEQLLPDDQRNFWTVAYGLKTWGDLFTPRQLVALTAFSDLVAEAIAQVKQDILGSRASRQALLGSALPHGGGSGAISEISSDSDLGSNVCDFSAYAQALSVYLGMALSRMSDVCNALCRQEVTRAQVRNLFGRQAIPMVWDFAETNVFGSAIGDYAVSLNSMANALGRLTSDTRGAALQRTRKRR